MKLSLPRFFTDQGGSLPTADDKTRGVIGIKRAASTEDEVHIGLVDSSNVPAWRRLVTTTLGSTLYTGIGDISYRIAPQTDTGTYYSSRNVLGGTAAGTMALTANRLYAIPFWTGPSGIAVDRISLDVSVGSAGGARMGVYQMSASAFRPGALLLDSGTVDVTASGFKEIAISQTLTGSAPYYIVWLALVTDATPTVVTITNALSAIALYSSYAYMNHTYGALPNPYVNTGFGAVANVPEIYVRKT